eukprot:9769025-Alexandrium_andersonii.AAC.1
MSARSASRGRFAPRAPKAEPADVDMRAVASGEAPAVATPAPAAAAPPDSDEDALEPQQLPAGGPCRKDDR